MVAISELFSLIGSPRSKLLILHAGAECSGSLRRVTRSLTSEHVIAEQVLSLEKARATPVGASLRRAANSGQPPSDEATLAVLRKWFWARPVERGFCVSGFPANLRQALAFDEWLEVRGEQLDAVIHPTNNIEPAADLLSHYRKSGLLLELAEES